MLITFTNPTPAASDLFGLSVAALGSDRVLIGAPGDDTGATDAGTVYLFATNGTLLTTFTNPTSASASFGWSVAAVGADRVLIGAYHNDTGANNAGAAYLFSTNGTLLFTFTNPTPAANDEFAYSVVGLGTDRMVVGARYDSTVEDYSGAAYVFAMESYSSGIIADSVRARSITTAQLADSAVTAAKLADGAVTANKLESSIGLWTASGSDIYFAGRYVGIGTTSPEAALHLAGQDAVQLRLQNSINNSYWNIYSESYLNSSNLLFISGLGGYAYFRATDGAYFNASDARLKRDVAPMDGILDRVLELRPVTYRLRADSESGPQTFGLIAQEVETLFPEVVGDCHGMKALSYSELVPVTIRAIQELNQKLTQELQQKRAEITELRVRNEALERRLDRLEQLESHRSSK